LKYNSEDYFSVIETKTGRKICDCGDEIDALMMVSFDPQNRTITRNQFLMGQVVDIEIPKQLPTSEIVFVETETKNVNKDNSKKLNDSKKKLMYSDLEPLNLS
jgi:hypothetical protein